MPYPKFPSRSSYYGIIDLAGFPKDPFYFYQSEWTNTPMLHIFPHWNWKQGEKVDVVAYFNNADEVELFLNGRSQGTKRKQGDDMHVFWRLAFEPGVLKAVSRKNGQVVLTREIQTAGEPARIVLIPDRATIKADGVDLSFVTVKVVDKNGTTHIKGHKVAASDDNPEYVVKSDKSGDIAAHNPDALTKSG